MDSLAQGILVAAGLMVVWTGVLWTLLNNIFRERITMLQEEVDRQRERADGAEGKAWDRASQLAQQVEAQAERRLREVRADATRVDQERQAIAKQATGSMMVLALHLFCSGEEGLQRTRQAIREIRDKGEADVSIEGFVAAMGHAEQLSAELSEMSDTGTKDNLPGDGVDGDGGTDSQ